MRTPGIKYGLLALVVTLAAPTRIAWAEQSQLYTATVRYAAPTSSGFESASVAVSYRFIECFGEIHIGYALVGGSLRAGSTYLFDGDRVSVDPAKAPQPSSIRFAGTVTHRAGAHVGRFADAYAGKSSGSGCYGQTQRITTVRAELGDKPTSAQVRALLDDLVLAQVDDMPPLTSYDIESRLRAERQAAKREAERLERERIETERRERERADRERSERERAERERASRDEVSETRPGVGGGGTEPRRVDVARAEADARAERQARFRAEHDAAKRAADEAARQRMRENERRAEEARIRNQQTEAAILGVATGIAAAIQEDAEQRRIEEEREREREAERIRQLCANRRIPRISIPAMPPGRHFLSDYMDCDGGTPNEVFSFTLDRERRLRFVVNGHMDAIVTVQLTDGGRVLGGSKDFTQLLPAGEYTVTIKNRDGRWAIFESTTPEHIWTERYYLRILDADACWLDKATPLRAQTARGNWSEQACTGIAPGPYALYRIEPPEDPHTRRRLTFEVTSPGAHPGLMVLAGDEGRIVSVEPSRTADRARVEVTNVRAEPYYVAAFADHADGAFELRVDSQDLAFKRYGIGTGAIGIGLFRLDEGGDTSSAFAMNQAHGYGIQLTPTIGLDVICNFGLSIGEHSSAWIGLGPGIRFGDPQSYMVRLTPSISYFGTEHPDIETTRGLTWRLDLRFARFFDLTAELLSHGDRSHLFVGLAFWNPKQREATPSDDQPGK